MAEVPDRYHEQRRRVQELLTRFSGLGELLRESVEATDAMVLADAVDLGQLTKNEEKDLLRHLERSAASARAAERITRFYLAELENTMRRDGLL
ncbi:hypothetical protein FPZ12_029820 [Amycolatopsis acidicola]|uniref:Uncharacterized protein n=1 Tax=Amycolatopsis acidicola TaxID=2596893 RepID=A0A5N0UT94_9PSEU|nr:hypothetical protein [Amycolatopsis acidicola]KAA9155389.1 hypothetical protein FPZ12_029820 [Amycolatopsis acidicola]